MGEQAPEGGFWPGVRRVLAEIARLTWFSVRRYGANQGGLRAGGLTYLTLMALVPGLTVVLTIAGAFGIKEHMREWVDEQLLPELPPKLAEVAGSIMQLVDRVDLPTLGALGLLAFVYLVMSLLTKVEKALNVTWEADRARTLARRYADYVAILFLVPFLVLLGTGIKALLAFAPVVGDQAWFQRLVASGVNLLPFLFIWMATILLYKVMPNVRVRWTAAGIAGLVAGTSWYVAQGVFLRTQIALSQTNAIYGSLALLPFLLIYLYLSWTIVLWGAELAFAVQNRAHLVPPGQELQWTPVRKRRLGLSLMRDAANAFARGSSLSLADFAGRTGWPRSRVDELAAILVEGRLVHRVGFGQAIVPARPPADIEIARILEAIDGREDGLPGSALTESDEALLREVRERLCDVAGRLR